MYLNGKFVCKNMHNVYTCAQLMKIYIIFHLKCNYKNDENIFYYFMIETWYQAVKCMQVTELEILKNNSVYTHVI